MAYDPSKIHFGSCVHEIIKRRGWTMDEAGKKAGLKPSIISKWKRGAWQVIPEKTLETLIDAISEHEEDRERLAAAYAYDMLPGSAKAHLRVVKIDAMAKKTDIRGLSGSLNTETRQKLSAIGEAVQYDEDLRRMFNSMADWAKRAKEKREAGR